MTGRYESGAAIVCPTGHTPGDKWGKEYAAFWNSVPVLVGVVGVDTTAMVSGKIY
jgi:hypothetical protein